MAQPFDVMDWKHGECDLVPGKTAPNIAVVERDYPATYRKFTSLGPALEKLGNGGKGIGWNTDEEVELLRQLNYTVTEGRAGAAENRDRHRRRGGYSPWPRRPTATSRSRPGTPWARPPGGPQAPG